MPPFSTTTTQQRPIRINNFDSRIDVFVDWILADVPDGFRVLDIGANNGKFCPEVERIFARASHVCGIDPDGRKLADNPYLHERYPTILEDAPLAEESFDLMFSIYVAEHVENPEAFMNAAFRALKPGGSLYMLTPNARHYFAIISGALKKANLQDRVLKMVRPVEEVDDYHYPAFYRLNSPAKINAIAQHTGFSSTEYRYAEHIRDLDPYFPAPLKFMPQAYLKMVGAAGWDSMLCNLMVRLKK
ncbi:MAG: methyltransferase domain-containing protein [Beijerinckiaceae bacterium]